jgi:LysM repeat protein
MKRILFATAPLALLLACGNDEEAKAPVPPAPAVREAPPAAPPPPPPPPPAEPVKPAVHVVAKGDTLYGIAREHGLDPAALARWNGIADPNLIRVGQEISLAPPE